MFRWIIVSSLQFRSWWWCRRGFDRLRVGAASKDARRRLSRIRGARRGGFRRKRSTSAKEVESLITLNLEELLSGVPWLKSIRSKSVTGLSSIVLSFDAGTDILRARQMIQERLTLAYTLPNVSHPPVILQPVSATSRFMMIGISSKKIEPTELSLLARWTIKPKLVGVPGVANVAIWGQKLRQMQVQIDPTGCAMPLDAGRHHCRRRRLVVVFRR